MADFRFLRTPFFLVQPVSIMMKNGIIKGNCLPSVVVALVAVLMSILAKGGDVELDDLLLNITH